MVIVLLVLLACSSRPADLAGFDGCWHQDAHLEKIPYDTGLKLAAGDRAVVVAGAHWGGSWFITDTEQFASLAIEVPPQPTAGQVLDLAGAVTQYSEGGMALAYDTRTLDRTLEILAVDADSVQVRIDATPTNTEVSKRPPIALTGSLDLRRVTGMRCR